MILAGHNSRYLASNVAKKLMVKCSFIETKKFPDGEIYIRFKDDVKGKNVIIIESFQPNPQDALAEIILAAGNAKDLGAQEVTLVAPYLGYMRQDNRFNSGEAVSAIIFANMICNLIDKLVTVDPHAHRIRDLSTIFHKPVTMLTANKVIADYIRKNVKADMIMGPDVESSQWAARIGGFLGIRSTILRKKRFSSRKVKVELTERISFTGKSVVIADDIISTGHTMAEAVKTVRRLGAKKVYCIAVHGLFVEKALEKLYKAGATRVLTCNTIENKQAKIDISQLIADAL